MHWLFEEIRYFGRYIVVGLVLAIAILLWKGICALFTRRR